jgi:uncharacterized membrane-anchored protein
VQIAAKSFRPIVYWTTIVATTTVGTTLADFADRSLGIGYAGGTVVLLAALATSLLLWQVSLGSVAIDTVRSPRAGGVLLDDDHALADFGHRTRRLDGRLGPPRLRRRRARVRRRARGDRLAYVRTTVSRTALFWSAFVVTRPLGAVVGDFLDKPVASGGSH